MAESAAKEAKMHPPTFSSISASATTVTILLTFSTKPLAETPLSQNSASQLQEHKFVVHKEFICYHSPFFSAAFKGNFEEGRTQSMKLEDIDPEVFAILVNWIYFRVVTNAEKMTADLVTCAKLWVLADRFLMRKLQNDAMSQIWDVLNTARSGHTEVTEFGEFCRIAAETMPEDNPLLKIAINILSTSKIFFEKWAEDIPNSIWLPVSKHLMLCRENLVRSVGTLPIGAFWLSERGYLVEEVVESRNSREN